MSDVGGAGGRVGGREYARRVNTAAELLAAGVAPAEAARVLAGRFGCSVRQARRYAQRAAAGGPAVVPEETTVFTVIPEGVGFCQDVGDQGFCWFSASV